MKIIMANPHLVHRAGSELLTLEVGGTLLARGHSVVFFTPVKGPFSEVAEQVAPVLSFGDEEEILQFAPDVIHSNDWPSLVALQQLGVAAPVVLGCLGVLPALHNPPPLEPGSSMAWWAVSPETRNHVEAIPGWRDLRHDVVGTWFDDRGVSRTQPRQGDIRSLVIVSNRMPDDLVERISAVAAESGIAVEKVGLPGPQREITPDFLGRFDALITLGRGAVLGMAVGLPVLIADVNGGDGWVTPDAFDALAATNFSGRARRLPLDDTSFRQWLSSPPSVAERAMVQTRVWRERRLTGSVDLLEGLLTETAAGRSSWRFGAWSGFVAELMLLRSHLEHTLGATSEALASATGRENAGAIRIAELEAQLDAAERRYEYVSRKWAKWTLQKWRRRIRR